MRILLQLPRAFSGKKARRGMIIALALVVLGIISLSAWGIANARQPATFTGKNTLPVNAPIEEQGIEFTAERVQPELQGENYFVNYRLQREQTRQEEKSMLSALLDSNVAKTKEEAQQNWLVLTEKIRKEDQIENLLKIKGFEDVIADVSSDSVNIIIYAPTLSPNEMSVIQDIVTRVAAVRLDRINISTRR